MGLDFGEYINADEIALSLPASSDRDRLAQQEADRRRYRALEERRSFSFETVMSHPSKVDEMRRARALGYHITFVGVALQDPMLNVARVGLRVSEGGHDVPQDRVIARYWRSLALMPSAIAIADRSLVFDNSDSDAGPVLALTTHRLSGRNRAALAVFLARSVSGNSNHWVTEHIYGKLLSLERSGEVPSLHRGADLQA